MKETIKHPFINGTVYSSTFNNGARSLVQRVSSRNVAHLSVWVLYGPIFEKKNEQGVGHLIEHLLFKGKQNDKGRKVLSTIENLGGELNAFTYKDCICVEMTILKKYLSKAILPFMQILFEFDFSQTELISEKNVIYQEIREDLEDMHVMVEELFFAKAYPYHVGHPILGTIGHLRKYQRDYLKKLFNKYFIPSRMVFSLVGDYSPTKFNQSLSEVFNNFKKTQTAQPFIIEKPKKIHKIKKFRTTIRRHCGLCYVVIGFNGIHLFDEQEHILEILDMHLSEGFHSALFKSLREDEGLLYSMETSGHGFIDCGHYEVSFNCKEQDLDNVIGRVKNIFEEIARDGIPKKRLDKYKKLIFDIFEQSFDSLHFRASYLSRSLLLEGKLPDLRKLRKKVRKLKNSDIQSFVSGMVDQGMSVSIIKPKGDKDASK